LGKLTNILTHRGLDPDYPDFPAESSYQAFLDHCQRGFGLEFDVCFLKDQAIGIFHDSTLSRLSNDLDTRELSQISKLEFQTLRLNKCRFILLKDLLKIIECSKSDLHALHFKAKYQNKTNVQNLCRELNTYPKQLQKILIFDLTPETARHIRELYPEAQLGCSVSREFEVIKYNSAVYGSLLSPAHFEQHSKLYDWAWLDEWELSCSDGQSQTNYYQDLNLFENQSELYNQNVFNWLRSLNKKIAVVSPELHATSPGLLGGEKHQDASPRSRLENRIKKILKLKPDAICSDFPDLVSNLIKI
jgi:glycerophosphoryl diester phosphodiesterase